MMGTQGLHGDFRVEHPLVHVDVEDVRAAAHLVERHLEASCEVSLLDQVREAPRAGDVGALPDHDEVRLGADGEELEATEAAVAGLGRRRLPRRQGLDGPCDGRDVLGRGPAAPAHQVHPAGLGELPQQTGGDLRGLVVLAEGVGEAGVRVADGEHVGDARELLHVGAEVPGAARAVHADGERAGVGDRAPERLHGLPREHPPREIRDRHRHDERKLDSGGLEDLLGGDERSLRVQGVEDRLDEQEVDVALDQRPHLLHVGVAHLVEGDGAVAGIVDVGREGQGLLQRPDRPRDEAGLVGRPLGGRVRRLPGDARRGEVDLAREVLEPVVLLADPGRRERVGLDEVCAGLEEATVGLLDHLGLGEHEHVVVALQVVAVVAEALAPVVGLLEPRALHHRAHGAVDHQDALGQEQLEALSRGGLGHDCVSSRRRLGFISIS
jgi:hypothetical protein